MASPGSSSDRLADAPATLLEGIRSLPIGWQLWVALLSALNLIGPFFFLDREEGRVVLALFLMAALVMTLLTHMTGFTRLLGLAHLVWFGLIPYLWARLPEIPGDDAFGIWVRGVIAANALSLVIDISDVVRYVAGEREDLRTRG